MILGAKRLVVTIYIQYHLCLKYEFALARVKELLPLVDDNIPANDKNAVELSVMSDIVIAYEKEYYPIEKTTVAELIKLYLEEKGKSQKQLAIEIGISPSRVNDYYCRTSRTYFENSPFALSGIEYSSHCNVGLLNRGL